MPYIASSLTRTGVQVSVRPCSVDVRVQHELRQRPVNPDHRAAQHDEAAAGQLGGGFEIHAGLHARRCRNVPSARSRSCAGLPQRRISTLSVSSGPSGTSSSGRLGMRQQEVAQARRPRPPPLRSGGRSRPSSRPPAPAAARIRRRRRAPWRRPRPCSPRFCSACAVSAARIFARRASSSARISDDSADRPRRARAASKAAGFSRMARMSCMAGVLRGRFGAGLYARFGRAGRTRQVSPPHRGVNAMRAASDIAAAKAPSISPGMPPCIRAPRRSGAPPQSGAAGQPTRGRPMFATPAFAQAAGDRRRRRLRQFRAADPDLRDHVFPADPSAAEEGEGTQGHGRGAAPRRSGADPGRHHRQGHQGATTTA